MDKLFSVQSLKLIAALVIYLTCTTGGSHAGNLTKSMMMMVQLQPAESEAIEYRVYEYKEKGNRRKLAPFQLCLPCKCCAAGGGGGSDPSSCTTMPCCFGIDCQLPDKPFGVCAFVPKTCNCTSCAM